MKLSTIRMTVGMASPASSESMVRETASLRRRISSTMRLFMLLMSPCLLYTASAEGGSSMMITFACREMDLAISTSCCWATLRYWSFMRGSTRCV